MTALRRVKPVTLYLWLMLPAGLLGGVQLWVHYSLENWVDDFPLSLMERMLVAVSNSSLRYEIFLGVPIAIAWPLLAVACARALAPTVEEATPRSVGTLGTLLNWLALAIGSAALSGIVFMFGDAFLGLLTLGFWSATVGFLFALTFAYRLQGERYQGGASRWHPAWFLAAGYALGLYFSNLVPFLMSIALYVIARRELMLRDLKRLASRRSHLR